MLGFPCLYISSHFGKHLQDSSPTRMELFQHFTANWNWKLHRIYWIYSNHHPLNVLCSHFPGPHPTGPPAFQKIYTMSLISVVLIANAAKVAGEKGEKVTAKSQLYLRYTTNEWNYPHITTHWRRRKETKCMMLEMVCKFYVIMSTYI